MVRTGSETGSVKLSSGPDRDLTGADTTSKEFAAEFLHDTGLNMFAWYQQLVLIHSVCRYVDAPGPEQLQVSGACVRPTVFWQGERKFSARWKGAVSQLPPMTATIPRYGSWRPSAVTCTVSNPTAANIPTTYQVDKLREPLYTQGTTKHQVD